VYTWLEFRRVLFRTYDYGRWLRAADSPKKEAADAAAAKAAQEAATAALKFKVGDRVTFHYASAVAHRRNGETATVERATETGIWPYYIRFGEGGEGSLAYESELTLVTEPEPVKVGPAEVARANEFARRVLDLNGDGFEIGR